MRWPLPSLRRKVCINLNRPSKPAFQARRRSGRGVIVCNKVAKQRSTRGATPSSANTTPTNPASTNRATTTATHDRGTVAAPPLPMNAGDENAATTTAISETRQRFGCREGLIRGATDLHLWHGRCCEDSRDRRGPPRGRRVPALRPVPTRCERSARHLQVALQERRH